MVEQLIWGALTLLITMGTGGAIVLTERRKRREARELELVEDVADRVEAMDDVEERLASLDARLAATERRLPPGNEP
jgi:hypothetical protein